MKIFSTSNGYYRIRYYNSSGRLVYNEEVEPNSIERTLYQSGGVTLMILADNTVRLTELESIGTHTFAVNAAGMAVEYDDSSGEIIYRVHILNPENGEMQYHATMVQTSTDVWEAQFAAPVSENIAVSYAHNPSYTINTYSFTYNNLAGHGDMQFQTDAKMDAIGNIISTIYILY
ncbi:MAG TPA: hypothetical protein P5203_17490 [Spirochaetota bacterium]|nr:hypothetical protein [Spirochaetota bacterium]HRT76907.1 hypothetical protein [Spirochaetota bacterium]